MKLTTISNRLLAAVLLLGATQLLTPLRAEAPVVTIMRHLINTDGSISDDAFPGDNPSDIRNCVENLRELIDNNMALPGSYCYVVAK